MLKSLLVVLFFLPLSCFDFSPVVNGGINNPRIASGPSNSINYPFADGIVKAAEETLGLMMANIETSSPMENAEMLISGKVQVAILPEDIFYYSRDTFLETYNASDDTFQAGTRKYLEIA